MKIFSIKGILVVIINRIIVANLKLLLKIYRTPVTIFDIFCKTYEECSNTFCRYRLYPKDGETINSSLLNSSSKEGELAIVIQGPVDKRNNFTLETIRIYKKIFPGALLILSTWEDTPEVLIKKIETEGCVVILNKINFDSGFRNLNYQIHSTRTGLKFALEKGATYVMKTRTDMRINRDFCFEYLKSLLKLFPVSGDGLPLKERIVTVSGVSGQAFFPSWLQDFIYFGRTEDVVDFFNIPLDNRPNGDVKYKNGDEFCKIVPPERYLTSSYLSKYNMDNETTEWFWDLLRKYFIVIDFSDLNLLWDKYQRYCDSIYESERCSVGFKGDAYRRISSHLFLSIYTGEIKNKKEFEELRFQRMF